jgi:hypothetical protein
MVNEVMNLRISNKARNLFVSSRSATNNNNK